MVDSVDWGYDMRQTKSTAQVNGNTNIKRKFMLADSVQRHEKANRRSAERDRQSDIWCLSVRWDQREVQNNND